jgi:hypothetical protein
MQTQMDLYFASTDNIPMSSSSEPFLPLPEFCPTYEFVPLSQQELAPTKPAYFTDFGLAQMALRQNLLDEFNKQEAELQPQIDELVAELEEATCVNDDDDYLDPEYVDMITE